MTTQLLRMVDRWRFETPLAVLLAAAAGFAAMAMPHETFGRLPVVGPFGMPAHVGLAALLAIVCGIAGYVAMRRPAKVVPIEEDADPVDDIDAPSGMSEDRLVRLRRADRHPDAPPRAPIRASRDLGEPFMDVGAFAPQPVRVEPLIVDGDYVEVEAQAEDVSDAEPVAEALPVDDQDVTGHAEQPTVEDVVAAPSVAEAPVAEMPAPISKPAPRPVIATPREEASIAAMMERLSAGMERRSSRPLTPARDMRPALRDALDELNRLAERRG